MSCNSSEGEESPSPSELAECRGNFGFENRPVDPDFTGDNKALGDVDGDGLPDLIIGGALLKWYAAPDFAPREIPGSHGSLAQHMEAADVNGDGAVDVITPDSDEIFWFENPRGSGGSVDDEWPRHLIGDHERSPHEVDLGDFNGDGKLDVVTNPNLNLWLQGEDGDTWTKLELHPFSNSEGMSVGFIDDDDQPDIAVRGGWVRTPDDAGDLEGYELFSVDAALEGHTTIKVADVDGDGRAEIVYAPKGIAGDIVVYATEDPAVGWVPQVVAAAGGIHDFVVTDMNRDGMNDLVFAEMADSLDKRVGLFVRSGTDWRLEVFATTGSHNIVVGDLDGDCDLDIAGSNWQSPPVEIWLNTLCGGGPRECE